jgi:hypothetical protein
VTESTSLGVEGGSGGVECGGGGVEGGIRVGGMTRSRDLGPSHLFIVWPTGTAG